MSTPSFTMVITAGHDVASGRMTPAPSVALLNVMRVPAPGSIVVKSKLESNARHIALMATEVFWDFRHQASMPLNNVCRRFRVSPHPREFPRSIHSFSGRSMDSDTTLVWHSFAIRDSKRGIAFSGRCASAGSAKSLMISGCRARA